MSAMSGGQAASRQAGLGFALHMLFSVRWRGPGGFQVRRARRWQTRLSSPENFPEFSPQSSARIDIKHVHKLALTCKFHLKAITQLLTAKKLYKKQNFPSFHFPSFIMILAVAVIPTGPRASFFLCASAFLTSMAAKRCRCFASYMSDQGQPESYVVV